ncbi:MAG: hypothetical protein IJ756_03860 [Paludibacteraceae bacterium]|nr:hypothetical protein [Paludibacteraceae bacterium]
MYEEIKSAISRMRSELDALQQRLDNELLQMQAANEEKEKQINALRLCIEEQNNKKTALEQQLAETLTLIETYKQQIRDLQDTIHNNKTAAYDTIETETETIEPETETKEPETETIEPETETKEPEQEQEAVEHEPVQQTPVSSATLLPPITDIRRAMSIADRYLFQRELFSGDAEKMLQTIDKLNNMNSLNDALEYISRKFHWDTNSQAYELFYNLLKRRF